LFKPTQKRAKIVFVISLLFSISYWLLGQLLNWLIGLLLGWLFERLWVKGILCTANCTLVKELLKTPKVFFLLRKIHAD
jgi:hypothetical protein